MQLTKVNIYIYMEYEKMNHIKFYRGSNTMTSEHIDQLQKLSKELNNITEDMPSNFNSNYYLQMVETEDSVIVIGNSEGLINLASSLLELALSREDGQHKHFGIGALDNCEKELEILYKRENHND